MSRADTLCIARPLTWISAGAYVALLAAGVGLVLLVCRAGADLTAPAPNMVPTAAVARVLRIHGDADPDRARQQQ